MMKKLAAILLVLLMVLSLAACGGTKGTDADTQDDTTPTEQGTDDVEAGDDAAEQVTFQRGTVEDSTYRNESLGIQLTMDENWLFFDDEQLSQLLGLVQDSFDDEDIKAQLEQGGSVYDMYVRNETDFSSINITVQDLESLGAGDIDEDSYADISLKQMPDMLAAAGMTVTNIEKATVDFAGAPHTALRIAATVGDEQTPVYETLVLQKCGTCIVTITCATYLEDTSADLVAMFQAL